MTQEKKPKIPAKVLKELGPIPKKMTKQQLQDLIAKLKKAKAQRGKTRKRAKP